MLRKEIATELYSSQINSHAVNDIAYFLGHDPKIHLEIYRRRIPLRDIVNITPILNSIAKKSNNDESADFTRPAEIRDGPSGSSIKKSNKVTHKNVSKSSGASDSEYDPEEDAASDNGIVLINFYSYQYLSIQIF